MQIKHCIHDRVTFAMKLPTRDQILMARAQLDLGSDAPLNMSFGLARMHPNDKNYVKKTGRETAIANMRSITVQLIACNSHKGILFPEFEVKVKDRTFYLSCKLTVGHDTPHFMYHNA